MRNGLVGVGRIGVFHAPTLRGPDCVDEVVVADADLARAPAMTEELDGEAAPEVRADLEQLGALARSLS